jgi:hypothetical protein
VAVVEGAGQHLLDDCSNKQRPQTALLLLFPFHAEAWAAPCHSVAPVFRSTSLPWTRAKINAALLRYCELDTLAMVMIVEAWKEFVFTV